MPRNTRVGGHGLVGEGSRRWRKNGRAYCECGELSEPDISVGAARRWMANHKDEIRVQRGQPRIGDPSVAWRGKQPADVPTGQTHHQEADRG